MTLYVYVANGNIRSKTETVLTEGAICGYVKEGDTLAATGESKEWYRVLYNEKTCYVRKKHRLRQRLDRRFPGRPRRGHNLAER